MKTWFYRTPLHSAAERGDTLALQILLQNPNIDVNVTDEIQIKKINKVLIWFEWLFFDCLWRTPVELALNDEVVSILTNYHK